MDPPGAWYADNIAQDYAFEGRMLAFFSWVASHDAIYRLGTHPRPGRVRPGTGPAPASRRIRSPARRAR